MSGPFKKAREALAEHLGLLYTRRWYERSARRKGHSAAIIAASLTRRYAPASVVDLGCGDGGFLVPFAASGCLALGLEHSRAGLALCAERGIAALPYDLRVDELPHLNFELCLCFEVAEHLHRRYAQRLVKTATALAPRVIFTAATPGQGGTRHVNEQPHEYWIDRFERCGFEFDGPASEELRALWAAGGVVDWLVANAMVFTDPDLGEPPTRTAAWQQRFEQMETAARERPDPAAGFWSWKQRAAKQPAAGVDCGWQAVFLDRDGTVNVEQEGWLTSPEQLELLPGVGAAIARLNAAGVKVILVTNQSAVGRGLLTEAGLAAIHARLDELLAAAGARLDRVQYCPHGPDSTCDCRKPRPGMLLAAAAELGLDPARTVTIGDAPRDLAAGAAAGCGATVLVRTGKGRASEAACAPTVVVDDLAAAVEWVLCGS